MSALVLLSGNLLPSRLCDDVTGTFQGPVRVGRRVWRDCCCLTPDWVTARVFLQRLFFFFVPATG